MKYANETEINLTYRDPKTEKKISEIEPDNQ